MKKLADWMIRKSKGGVQNPSQAYAVCGLALFFVMTSVFNYFYMSRNRLRSQDEAFERFKTAVMTDQVRRNAESQPLAPPKKESRKPLLRKQTAQKRTHK